jgi:hypothetical protein
VQVTSLRRGQAKWLIQGASISGANPHGLCVSCKPYEFAEVPYTPNGTLVVTMSVANKTEESWETPTATGRAEQTGTGLFVFRKHAEFTRTLTQGSYVTVRGCRVDARV